MGEIRFGVDEVLEEITFGGMLENEDVVRGWLRGLFILLITHEGHVLAVLEAAYNMRVSQGLEGQVLIFKVFLLLAVLLGDYLQHQSLLLWSVAVNLGVP